MGSRGRTVGFRAGVVACILSVGLATAFSRPSLAEENSSTEPVIGKISLVNAEFSRTINSLQAETGANITLLSSDKPYGLVNVTLTNKPLDYVLKQVCESAGAEVRNEDGVYVIGPKGSFPAVVEPIKPAVNPSDTNPVMPTPVHRRIEKIKLQYTRPTDLLRYFNIEQGPLNRLEDQMIYGNLSKARTAQPLYKSPGTLVVGPSPNGVPTVVPTNEGVPTNNEDRASADKDEAGQYGGYGGYGGQGGYGGYQGYGQRGVGGYQGGAFQGAGQTGPGGVGGAQGGLFGNIAPNTTKLGYDVDNTIIAIGPDDEIAELKEIIRLLDVAPRQLIIRSQWVEVTVNEVNNFGISWSLQRGSFSAATPSGFAVGSIGVSFASGNLVAQLATELSMQRGRTINAPMVTTTNNVPVSFTVATEIPIITNQVVFTGQGSGTVVPQVQVVPVQTMLSVWPRINGDDSITMVIQPQLADAPTSIPNPSGGVYPIIEQRQLMVVRRVKNGETMVIGGLIRKNDQTSIQKIPLLSDLPLIGSLFTSRSVNNADSELLIFVTPEIIPDEPSSSAVTVGGAAAGGAAAGGGAVRP